MSPKLARSETISATFTTCPARDTRPITCPRAAHASTSPPNNTPRTTPSYTTPRGTTFASRGLIQSDAAELTVAAACALVGALVISNVLLWNSLSSTKSDLKNAQVKVNRLDSAAAPAFQKVADRVGAIEAQLGDVGSGSEDLSARVDDAESALNDLYSCVDDFLHGFDAANGGYFTYQFC